VAEPGVEQPPGVGRPRAASDGGKLTQAEHELQSLARKVYEDRLEAGIAREQARKDLPLSTYTEAYWKIDLQNLLHFLELRMDEHAQLEIRAYASVIGEQIVAKWVPLTWEAFLDYRRGGTRLSRIESAFLAALSAGDRERAIAIADEGGFLSLGEDGRLKPNLEGRELEEKLERMGLQAPWM